MTVDKNQFRKNIGTNIEFFRKEAKLTKIEAAKKLSDIVGRVIDSSSFSNWESGRYSPDIKILDALCEVLNCTINEIFGTKDLNIEKEESELINSFRNLSPRQKIVIRDVIKGQLGLETTNKITSLKLFNEPACAGKGNIITSNDYELVEFSNAPVTAKFAIRAQGDSMKPIINNNDILFINPDAQLTEGEIGLFSYQGETYIKKLSYNPIKKKYILKSLNPKYTDITVLEDSNDFYICGRIL